MKINIPFVGGAIYIAFWAGIAVADVGEKPECVPYEWWLPLIILAAFLFPFICGYLAGLEEGKAD